MPSVRCSAIELRSRSLPGSPQHGKGGSGGSEVASGVSATAGSLRSAPADPHEWGHHVQHGEQQRLRPVQAIAEVSVQAQRDQFVQPGHQVAGTASSRWSICAGSAYLASMKPYASRRVSQDRRVLPEDLIDDVTVAKVNSCHSDRTFRLAPSSTRSPRTPPHLDPVIAPSVPGTHEARQRLRK